MYYIYSKNDQPNRLTLADLTCVDEGEKIMCIYKCIHVCMYIYICIYVFMYYVYIYICIYM